MPPKYRYRQKSKKAILVAKNVRGLQIGERNFQLNSYKYEVQPDKDKVDLSKVLTGSRVFGPLSELAQDPTNPSLAAEADRALKQVGQESRSGSCSVKLKNFRSLVANRRFLSFLFVSDSKGVQVGDNMRQENYFTYVVAAPSMNIAQLIATDSQLRSEILQDVRAHQRVRTGGRLANAVDDSLKAAALEVQRHRTTLRPTPGSVLEVKNLDGVTVGWDVDQVNKVRTVVVAPADLKS